MNKYTKYIAQIMALTGIVPNGPYTRMGMNEPTHPNVYNRNGKLMFWSIGKQCYIESACQPKRKK